ncbi:ATP-binding protein [Leptospira sp. 96542]|nr:ATP-binding protein [Leptospira sp. 96542]
MPDSKIQIIFDLLSHSRDGIVFVDTNSKQILYNNDSVYNHLDYEPSEIKCLEDLFIDPNILLEKIQKPNSLEKFHKWFVFNRSQKKIPVTISIKPLTELFEDYPSVVCILIEWPISHTNQIHSEEKLRTFFASMNNGIVIVNRDGYILDVAPIFKFTLFQFLALESGENIFSFLDENLKNKFLLVLQDVIDTVTNQSVEFEYTILDELRYFEIKFIPIRRRDPNEQKTMMVFSDITETKKLDMQLIQSMKFASLGEIATGLAHEINNPLQSALLYLEDLITVDESDPKERQNILKKIESANLRIRDLVRALLDLGRVESPNRDFVSPYYILVRASELVEVSCKKNSIQFTRHAGPNLPGLFVRWQEIEQVLINCVVNSINAISEMETKRENPKIELGIDLKSKQRKDWIVFSVEDNGPGMDEETLEKVFLPLFTTRRTKQGTGLGLSISKKIINDHGGEIYIKSKLGVGTKIEMYLPAQTEENG